MGSILSEPKGPEFQQATDVAYPTPNNPAGVSRVAEDEFLTRPLWGVADTGPWLHDGRAQSLMEAIVLHNSPGSDASPIIAGFMALPADSQQDVIEFLRTLRLSIDSRYGFDIFP
jgi:Di-haem oxidoreductase, putative peroxidase